MNPYEPTWHQQDIRHKGGRLRVTSTAAFTIGTLIAMTILMFAPGQPHPNEYTAFEKVLIVLTWNWISIISSILGFALLFSATCHAVSRLWNQPRKEGGH